MRKRIQKLAVAIGVVGVGVAASVLFRAPREFVLVVESKDPREVNVSVGGAYPALIEGSTPLSRTLRRPVLGVHEVNAVRDTVLLRHDGDGATTVFHHGVRITIRTDSTRSGSS